MFQIDRNQHISTRRTKVLNDLQISNLHKVHPLYQKKKLTYVLHQTKTRFCRNLYWTTTWHIQSYLHTICPPSNSKWKSLPIWVWNTMKIAIVNGRNTKKKKTASEQHMLLLLNNKKCFWTIQLLRRIQLLNQQNSFWTNKTASELTIQLLNQQNSFWTNKTASETRFTRFCKLAYARKKAYAKLLFQNLSQLKLHVYNHVRNRAIWTESDAMNKKFHRRWWTQITNQKWIREGKKLL
jgi:hypothetical protein